MLSIFKKMLGSKSQRDIKAIDPMVATTLTAWDEVQKLSNDELRARTGWFREKIRDYVAAKEQEIAELKAKLASDELEIDEKESLYSVLDKLEKEAYELTQEVLREILPEAFAVMKDTARRFTQNEFVEVTATQFDRDLAARKPSVEKIGRAHV